MHVEVPDYVHSSNATCILSSEGSFDERRRRLERRLLKSREVTRADLVQRNIVQGSRGSRGHPPGPAIAVKMGIVPGTHPKLEILWSQSAFSLESTSSLLVRVQKPGEME
ncbi:unnamed protein product [Effrenium voratum]|uniref:Uncharacterized protein n=1 Tax=Effrenium voratum TaxID=2562239 RepID=A0AA36HTB5_9DINO|nr:unnamed protein product [Effrenium voratum]